MLSSRVTTTPSENKIKDVNILLDELASSTGEQAKSNIIREKILRSYSAMEQVHIIEIDKTTIPYIYYNINNSFPPIFFYTLLYRNG